MQPQDHIKLQGLYYNILQELGENPEREGLIRTPERVAHTLSFLTSGYHQNIKDIINDAIFQSESEDMIIVKDIELYSLCEHHMLPFFGKVHVAYLPDQHIIGVSKIPRIVDLFSHRLQIQERLTQQIAHAIEQTLNTRGVGVVIKAQHLCMMMRGVQKQNSQLITSTMLGALRESQASRTEFLSLIQ